MLVARSYRAYSLPRKSQAWVGHRAGNQVGREHMVEVGAGGDVVGEVELPRAPEAQVGQLLIPAAAGLHVQFDEVHDVADLHRDA